jgi:hypothetical protein
MVNINDVVVLNTVMADKLFWTRNAAYTARSNYCYAIRANRSNEYTIRMLESYRAKRREYFRVKHSINTLCSIIEHSVMTDFIGH